MKKLFLFKLVFIFSLNCFAQKTLFSDKNGVIVNYNIENTGEKTKCQLDENSDENFSTKNILIWKVTLTLINKSSTSITPYNVGVATINIVTKLRMQSYDYCHIDTRLNVPQGMSPTLAFFNISDVAISEIKPGEKVSRTTYLYVYNDDEPLLDSWEFYGYRNIGNPNKFSGDSQLGLASGIIGNEINNNPDEDNAVTNTTNADALSDKLDEILNDSNFIQNNPQLVQQMTSLIRSTDFNNEASVNRYVEEAQKMVNNYLGLIDTSNTSSRASKTNKIKQVANEMNLRNDEVEILEIFNNSENLNEAYSKLKKKNIQSLNKYTLDALNKIVGDNNDFSITGSDIQVLLNGSNLTEVLKGVNLRNSNKIAQGLGLDSNQTQVLNIIATSGNKEEMTKRLNEHNIKQISETTANGLQKLLGDSYGSLPISSGDITNMLNGDFDTAIVNMKQNQDINAFTEVLGGDRELANTTYNALSLLGEEMQQRRIERASEVIDIIKSFDRINQYKNGSFKANNPFDYTVDFNDSNWSLKENEFVKLKKLNKEALEIEFIKEVSFNKLKINDYNFITFKNDNFSIGKDYLISFELSYYTNDLLKDKNALKTSTIAFFPSNTNKITLGPIANTICNSFTPIYNDYNSVNTIKYEMIPKQNPKIYYNVMSAISFATSDWSNRFYFTKFHMDENGEKNMVRVWDIGFKKAEINTFKKEYEYLYENIKKNKYGEKLTFIYTIEKKGDKLSVKKELLSDKSFQKTEILDFEYKYLDKNTLSFGLSTFKPSYLHNSGGYIYRYVRNGEKGQKIIISNIKIKQ